MTACSGATVSRSAAMAGAPTIRAAAARERIVWRSLVLVLGGVRPGSGSDRCGSTGGFSRPPVTGRFRRPRKFVSIVAAPVVELPYRARATGGLQPRVGEEANAW